MYLNILYLFKLIKVCFFLFCTFQESSHFKIKFSWLKVYMRKARLKEAMLRYCSNRIV